ncbi:MAG: hypothetical protein SWK76_10925 [Actinomycetota bacterium]|nr:hypothetical protein [Actinomycetota bacterium]
MKMSLERFPRSILEKMLDICWCQWSALGIYTNIAPEMKWAIDPEALICATMFYGRYDPRLFDEVLDWISVNEKILNFNRLKKTADAFGPKYKACLGASLEYVAADKKSPRFLSTVDRWKESRLVEEEYLFLSWGSDTGYDVKDTAPTFGAWGFLRNEPNLRGLSGKPDMRNSANLFLRLRKLFGVTSRASILGYLLLKGDGNSMRISKAVNVNQRNVYHILNEMTEGEFLLQWSGGRESVFSIDREPWLEFFDIDKGLRFIRWADVFSTFQFLLEDWAENGKAYSTAYLAASRIRDNSSKLLKGLDMDGVGYRIPDLSRYRGESYFHAFAEHIQAYLDRIVS